MASVREFVCEAVSFPKFVLLRQASLENVYKLRHFAAIKIQRVYRGYRVRKEILKWHRAATVLQKYIRRWLVLWNLPNFYRDYYDWFVIQYYHRMATRIQALWRGYWVRKDRVDPKDLLKERLEMEEQNREMQRMIEESRANTENDKSRQLEEEAQKWVLFILFKLHHHLRTYTRKGIFSRRNSNRLSPMEELLKAIPLTNYMRGVKRRYYSDLAKEQPSPPPYRFQGYIMRNLEDAYRHRDRSHDLKNIDITDVDTRYTGKQPFVLSPRVREKPYKRSMFSYEPYPPRNFIFRCPEPYRNISHKDFDLNVYKKGVFKEQPPPYYLDHWTRICKRHDILD